MTTITSPARRWHRPLLCTSAAMAALALCCLCAMPFDDRRILGESVWLKPGKFGIAFCLYTLTLAWLLSVPHRGARVTWWAGTVFAVTGVVDVGFIVVQAARGTFSHFDTETDAVNSIGQMVFASGVPGLFLANLVVAVILCRQRVLDRPTTRAVHAGLAIAVAGMALGYLMGFTGEQTVRDAQGRPVRLAAGHTVTDTALPMRDGVGDMPITHWSTIGGDLRIPHFAGLHGIQFLLAAVAITAWLARRRPWLDERVRARLIGVLSLGYAGLVALLLWQALRAVPLIHPDRVGVLAFLALGVVTAGAGAAVVRHGQHSRVRHDQHSRVRHNQRSRSASLASATRLAVNSASSAGSAPSATAVATSSAAHRAANQRSARSAAS
ncbi:putative membrane protein [Nocardia kruczakiae]|uniref:Membrane protein n=1 Tax=Nocardia kruczakiae TaxID=261477 RepID=A0ABU1XA91_9NOCA|nr:putative membrane protein [Nocardia kruczakiae]